MAKTNSKNRSTSAKKTATKNNTSRKSGVIAGTDTELMNDQSNNVHRWNAWIGIAYLLEAILLFIFGKGHNLPVSAHYLAIDPLLSNSAGHAVLVSATHQLVSINIFSVLVVFLLLLGIYYFMEGTVLSDRLSKALSKGQNPYRWLANIIFDGTTWTIVSMLVGIQSLSVMLLIAAFVVFSNILKYATEGLDKTQGSINTVIRNSILIMRIIPWVALLSYIVYGLIYGNRLGYYVYVAAIILLVSMLIDPLLIYLFRKKMQIKNYAKRERAYIVTDFVARSLIVWLIFAGLLKS